MNYKLLALIMLSLVVGAGIGYASSLPQISILESKISDLELEISKLEESYGQLVKYFFVKDSNFTIPLDENVYWGVEAWNKNPDSICEIKDGILHLFYNKTTDYSYGNSGVFQGRHTDGRYAHQLLVGDYPENAFFGDYTIFPKSLQSSKFWLETKFRITRIGFNRFPSQVNLGITLMCAINNEPFNLSAQTLWLDVYFAGYYLNATHIWTVPKNWNYVSYPDDIHAGYFVGEVPPSDFGKWITISIDLGDYISKTLNLITKTDIKTIRVYGFIVFVECLEAYAEVEYNYVNTILK
jgi:hypothetical protein